MRGSQIRDAIVIPLAGIIPAHAGLTVYALVHIQKSWDHPRACGAHIRDLCMRYHLQGSSPRMRGSQNRTGYEKRNPGIIPAHAGLTTESAVKGITRRDHPRACGAHQINMRKDAKMAGSSPRMRGSRTACSVGVSSPGIIPAHAGLTR